VLGRAIGLVTLTAAVAGIELLVHWLPTFLAYLAAFFLSSLPFVGPALAYYGAAYGRGWHWYWALALAVPQPILIAILIPIVVLDEARPRRNRRPQRSDLTSQGVAIRGRRNKVVRRILAILATAVLACVIVISLGMAAARERLFDLYMQRLDAWISAGGDIKTVQAEVVETCGKLILTQARWFERMQLMTFYRDELDFRVDVCTKLAANRLYPQPEFQKPELVTMICDDPNPYHELFRRLCRRSGLRPAK